MTRKQIVRRWSRLKQKQKPASVGRYIKCFWRKTGKYFMRKSSKCFWRKIFQKENISWGKLGKPSCKKSAVFFNIVQKPFDPPFVWTLCGEFFWRNFNKNTLVWCTTLASRRWSVYVAYMIQSILAHFRFVNVLTTWTLDMHVVASHYKWRYLLCNYMTQLYNWCTGDTMTHCKSITCKNWTQNLPTKYVHEYNLSMKGWKMDNKQ